MKKLVAAVSLAVCMLGVTACGSANLEKLEPKAQATVTTNITATDNKVDSSKGIAKLHKLKYHSEDKNAPIVLFTKDTSSQGLIRIYEALGRKAEGKVAIKMSFETPNGPYLSPELIKPLRDKVNATMVDSNGFTPPRNRTESHMRLIENHGFTKIGPVDVLDAEGEIDMPVKGRFLKFHRTGSHFEKYDSVISLVKFKAHHIRDYGGTIKNLTICLGSISGKANIHSGGKELQSYKPADMEVFLESMADATRAALDYKKDKWVFINVMTDLIPDDEHKDAPKIPDIGIIASLDPVAVDQAGVDFTFSKANSEGKRAQWEQEHNTRVLKYAEERGVGKRHYRLVSID